MNIKKAIASILVLIAAAGGTLEVAIDNEPVNTVLEGEIVSERTANARVFATGDVERLAHVYTTPIHYEKDGQFKTIDLEVKRKPPLSALLGKYEYEAKTGIYDAHFDAGKPWNYRMEVGDSWIEFEALFGESASVMIEVETTRLGIKETITLLDSGAPNEFRWIVKSNGLQPDEPWAVDAEDNDIAINSYSLGDTLVYELDVAGVTYPVELDPSTTVQVTNDGSVRGSDPSSYATARDMTTGDNLRTDDIQTGQLLTSMNVYRGFYSFAIPTLTSVQACSLYINGSYDGSAADFEIYIHSSTYGPSLTMADYNQFDGWTSGSAHTGTVLNEIWNSSSYSDDWNKLEFNTSGRSAVVSAQEDTLWIVTISKEDYNNLEPAVSEFLQFNSSADGGSEPYLSFVYEAPITIKLSGGTYSSWAAFWDDLGNLTGNITCTVDASAFTEGAAPAVVTENLNGYTLHVLPAAFPTTTDAATGARFTCNYAGVVLELSMEGPGDIIIEGMVFIEGTSEPAYMFKTWAINTEFNYTLRRNIIKGGLYGIQPGDIILNAGTKIYNNIIYDASSRGFNNFTDIASAVIANNTFVHCDNNIYGSDEETTFENNLCYGGITTDFTDIGTLAIGNNNANSDATGEDADWGGGGANNVNSIADPFNNLGADDFTITAEGVIGTAGKDLSGSFTDDFFGVTRSNWTIGACEFVSLGWTGTALGLDNPAGVLGVDKANLKNFLGVE